MKPLNARLLDYLKSNPSIAEGILIENEKELVKLFQSCVNAAVADAGIPESSQPLDLTVKLIGSTFENGVMNLSFGFDHAGAIRESMSPNTGNVDLIYLFNNGYSISAYKRLPVGIWHGRRTVAWRSRSGKHFVQAAVDQFNAKAPVGVRATYSESYYR